VYDQTWPPAAHVIVAQRRAPGPPYQPHVSAAYNLALEAVKTPWVLRLDDDNYLLSQAVENFMAASPGSDVVLGPEHGGRVPWGCTMMAATGLVRGVGGWPTKWRNGHLHNTHTGVCLNTCEDQALRQTLEGIGARFIFAATPVYVLGDQGHPRMTDDVPEATPCPGADPPLPFRYAAGPL
jgi:hypothetical protein